MSNSRNSKVKTPEHTMQKRLTYVALGSLCATPFIGPAGLLGFGAVITGKVLRPLVNKKARKDYAKENKILKQQKQEERIQRDYTPAPYASCTPSRPNYFPSAHIGYSETPQTALAKKIPRKTLSLLEKEAKRNHYDSELVQGADIVNTYLNRISKEELDNIKEITIIPGEEKRFLGIPLKRKKLEVKIENDL